MPAPTADRQEVTHTHTNTRAHKHTQNMSCLHSHWRWSLRCVLRSRSEWCRILGWPLGTSWPALCPAGPTGGLPGDSTTQWRNRERWLDDCFVTADNPHRLPLHRTFLLWKVKSTLITNYLCARTPAPTQTDRQANTSLTCQTVRQPCTETRPPHLSGHVQQS